MVGYAAVTSQAADVGVASTRCDLRVNPLGVDSVHPRLSWTLRATDAAARGVGPSAYRILVASSMDALAKDQGDLWDSDEVKSGALIADYAGAALTSSQQVFWKVRVWDQSHRASNWSERATWTMGVLNPQDWRGQWISAPGNENIATPTPTTTPTTATTTPATSPAPRVASLLLRREFVVKPNLRRAVAHVTGVGHYELTLNGKKAGDAWLTPGWTDYHHTVLYDTCDVTSLLQRGDNAAGIFLGNGMYDVEKTKGRYIKFDARLGPQKTIAQLKLDYADGTTEWVTTDEHWTTHPGPITFSNVFGGEDDDARLDPHGWDQARFDAAWSHAVVTPGPGGTLKGLSVSNPPIRALKCSSRSRRLT